MRFGRRARSRFRGRRPSWSLPWSPFLRRLDRAGLQGDLVGGLVVLEVALEGTLAAFPLRVGRLLRLRLVGPTLLRFVRLGSSLDLGRRSAVRS